MKFNREAVSVEEATNRLMSRLRPGPTETVALEEACGRRLAERLTASHPVPRFHKSVMDGFALRSAETAGASIDSPVRLVIAGVIPCGSVLERPLVFGEAARIMTGAALPEGADAVVMLEDTDTVEEEGRLLALIRRELGPGTNISRIGMEMKEGDLLLEDGRWIGPGESALLAMFGKAAATVYRRPRVAVLATGSELLRVEDSLRPGCIRDSNSYMLASQLREAGACPVLLAAVSDNMEEAERAIKSAMDEYDAVITIGGVSVGDYDFVYDLTASWDGELLFNKVAMRPGSPTTVAARGGKLLFALSGNPGACFVAFELFVRPALLAMQGERHPWPRPVAAVAAEDLGRAPSYVKYVRGRCYVSETGMLHATPVGHDASGITLSIRDANCLIVVPPGENSIRAGEQASILLLGNSLRRSLG